MAKVLLEPCPKCQWVVEIFPGDGGTKTSGKTSYTVECTNPKCDLREEDFGGDTGRTDYASREWNRWAKKQRPTDTTGAAK